MTVYYNVKGAWTIQGIQFDFTLQTVASLIPSWDTTTPLTPVPIPQAFAINFQQVFAIVLNEKAGATNIWSRSGNPGYLFGKPVLAGNVVVNGSASAINLIADPRFGITLAQDTYSSSAGRVQCPASTDYGSRSPVNFGESAQTGCSLWLTLADFSTPASCAALSAKIAGIQATIPNLMDHVAKFGNASVTNVNTDWIPIVNTTTGITSVLS